MKEFIVSTQGLSTGLAAIDFTERLCFNDIPYFQLPTCYYQYVSQPEVQIHTFYFHEKLLFYIVYYQKRMREFQKLKIKYNEF